ncbi:MAG TPA: hypothetical protein VK401_02430 [Propionibacteriaceae bacterium]|jgi:hypothetical protein|nr:hypothetical protein [Propionibacteriaceae bacterium]
MEQPVSGPRQSRRTTGAAAHRTPPDQAEERSLDLVQRMIVSALIIVVFGLFAAMLAAYIAVYPEESSRSSTIGLWAMSGVFGLASAAAVLVVNRRRPYSPWVALGLLPMAAAGFWVF